MSSGLKWFLEQNPKLPSTSNEASNMSNIATTAIQHNSESLLFANLIESASAENLYFDGQNEPSLIR